MLDPITQAPGNGATPVATVHPARDGQGSEVEWRPGVWIDYRFPTPEEAEAYIAKYEAEAAVSTASRALDTKRYNITDLDPKEKFEKHIFHRDHFAHYLRWCHVLKEARKGDVVVDFGCGKGYLLEVLYRNQVLPSRYVGIDIREQTIAKAGERWKSIQKFSVEFIADDLVRPRSDLALLAGDVVASFEVAEHVGRQNVPALLRNFMLCGAPGARYYLSTPNYDPKVGAARNHTYDSGDGRGVAVHELDHSELAGMIADAGFEVVEKFGTFASQRDYEPRLDGWQRQAFDALHSYYDSSTLACIMAPMMPAELARNCMWVLRRAV